MSGKRIDDLARVLCEARASAMGLPPISVGCDVCHRQAVFLLERGWLLTTLPPRKGSGKPGGFPDIHKREG